MEKHFRVEFCEPNLGLMMRLWLSAFKTDDRNLKLHAERELISLSHELDFIGGAASPRSLEQLKEIAELSKVELSQRKNTRKTP